MRGFAASLLLIVVGIAIAALAGDHTAVTAVGVAVAGIGSVVGVSAAFWLIGRSEDRERERDGPGP